MTGGAITIREIAERLETAVSAPIVDRTGLAGVFDIDLEYTPSNELTRVVDSTLEPNARGVSIFTAVQEQLGLKLQPAQGPVEVLVIDSVERPTPN
jgi:uncharacterized protein (TIGR03435 family)